LRRAHAAATAHLVVFQTLIITPRHSPARNALYMAYWRLIMRLLTSESAMPR